MVCKIVYQLWYTSCVADSKKKWLAPEAEATVRQKRIPAIFFRTEAGGEPVRDWLKSLSRDDRKLIGIDIMTVEFGWPIGMPVCRPLRQGLYEVRSTSAENRVPACSSMSINADEWSCCTGSSKKLRRRLQRI